MKLFKFSIVAFSFLLLVLNIYTIVELNSKKHSIQEYGFKRALNAIKQNQEAEFLDSLIWDLKPYEFNESYEKRFWYAYILSIKYTNGEKNENIYNILSCIASEENCDVGLRVFMLAEEICRYSEYMCQEIAPYWYSQAKLLGYKL